MSTEFLQPGKATEVILAHLNKYGQLKSLNQLNIYRKDPTRVYAEWYRLKKESKIKEVNGITYLV
jgi:hypothetical protein